MKKKIALFTVSLLMIFNISACSMEEKIDINLNETESSSRENITTSSNEPSINTSATNPAPETVPAENSDPETVPLETESAIYGEDEIPDLPEYYKVLWGEENPYTEDAVGCMVFETHVFGDYKISLVGDKVRTDKDSSPDIIFAQDLRVEVEKNGEKLSGSGGYTALFHGVSQLTTYKLFTDKIGSYIDFYDLENPVIAMRYYYSFESPIKKAVQFATIHNNEVNGGFAGVSEKGTGVTLGDDGNDEHIMINDEDGTPCRISIFFADKFKVIDNRTLCDEEAGIKYTFNFSDPPQFELYTAEKIN